MAETSVVIKTTPADLEARYRQFPKEYDRRIAKKNQKLKKILVKAIPPYPNRSSPYERTFRLGRSLGQYGRVKADIERVERIGVGSYAIRIGSKVSYAQYVVGPGTQAWMHQGIWYTLDQIPGFAEGDLQKHAEEIQEEQARWLDGK